MSSKPPPSPEFLARVRSSVFFWLGQYLSGDVDLGPGAWKKLLQLYEYSFRDGLRDRLPAHYPAAEKWWDHGLPKTKTGDLGKTGRKYGESRVEEMCKHVNALPAGTPVTPDQLQTCFEKVSKAAHEEIKDLNDRNQGPIVLEPIFC